MLGFGKKGHLIGIKDAGDLVCWNAATSRVDVAQAVVEIG